MIWNRKGPYSGDRWKRFRIPIKAREQGTQVLLKGIVSINNFIIVSNTKLVDSNGNEISCGKLLSFLWINRI